MIDSHCHLALCEDPVAELLDEASAAGVDRLLTVGLDEASNTEAMRLAAEHEAVLAAVGRHPNSASGFDDDASAAIEELAADDRVGAIGETGLDFYRDAASRDDQRRAFAAQIEIARRAGKPLVVHMRESIAETFAMLRDHAEGVTIILHCFSGDDRQASEAAAAGWHCSFAGNLTYPRSHSLRAAARAVPDELLLVETDAPFLAPQPRRGKPNRPAGVVETAQRLAAERGVAYAELEATVEANAARVFGW